MKTNLIVACSVVLAGLCNSATAQDTSMHRSKARDTSMNNSKASDASMNNSKASDTSMNNAKISDMSANSAKAQDIPDMSSWPKASATAAQEMMDKYGKPDMMGDEEMVWFNQGTWKKITVSKAETRHIFPVEHTDMMEQTVSYKVPTDKLDDLGKFDGSVKYDRTQGLLSARCDVEANNFLALNLAYDIIKGKKTAEQARKSFADIVKEKMKGGDPVYMQKLMFTPQENSMDTDVNTTGLDKEGNKVTMKKDANKDTMKNGNKNTMKKMK